VHELALVEEILKIVEEASGGARVSRVVLQIGRLSAAMPEAIRFCFDLAAEGTVASGAALDIVEIPGRGRCRDCGAESVLESPLGRCGCGGGDLDWIAGTELRVQALEVG
jgi:hydrogenase nickel incorporation protein HypA/HybF